MAWDPLSETPRLADESVRHALAIHHYAISDPDYERIAPLLPGQPGHPARPKIPPSHHSPPVSGARPFTYRPYQARYRSKRSFWKDGLPMPWCSPG